MFGVVDAVAWRPTFASSNSSLSKLAVDDSSPCRETGAAKSVCAGQKECKGGPVDPTRG